MSNNQRQREATGSVKTTCRYEYWWKQRQRNDKRGSSPGISAPIPSDGPPTIFDPEQSRLFEPPRRITDLEKGLQHSPSASSLSSESNTSIRSATALLEKVPYTTQQLPPKRHHPIIRRLRYTLFAVYQLLFTLIFLLNLACVLILLHLCSWNTSTAFQLPNLATFASSNFLLAILFRQDWLVNILFRAAWLVPWALPLRVRRVVGRVYCYGGIHSGAAIAGTGWWVAFTGMFSWEAVNQEKYTPELLVLTLVIASLLIAIVVLSLPGVRRRYHDMWEMSHRFLGWASVALFWAQILMLTHYTSTSISSEHGHEQSFTDLIIRTPTFWNLIAITLLLAYPWMRLRRWTFVATPLSDHALQLSFPNKVHKYSCLVLSNSPWKEWHPFATFPSPLPGSSSHSGEGKEEMGNSLVVSAAGDWTRSLITTVREKSRHQRASSVRSSVSKTKGDEAGYERMKDFCTNDSTVKMQFYIKSHPRAGVLSLSCLYKRVLILTTGSGIGPSLSSLLDRPVHPSDPSKHQIARLIWSTRSPLATYGPQILDLVHEADPDALVLDTDAMGRPDLLSVAWRVYQEMAAEAVFVLSNEKVTREVVGGLERRGVPAFGPIWDS
jgi:hypothetical protein